MILAAESRAIVRSRSCALVRTRYASSSIVSTELSRVIRTSQRPCCVAVSNSPTTPHLENVCEDRRLATSISGGEAFSVGNKSSVGVIGEHRNVYYGVGYGEGVPSSQTAGRIIADLMAGESNAFTNHYVVNRSIPYAGPTALRKYFATGAKWLMKKFDLPLYR